MRRFAAVSMLCALVAIAGVLTAAPAPIPRTTGPWFDGWDKPVDPVGDCRFDRKGDKLTITVPGKRHELDIVSGRLNAPRLLRDVEGDFEVQVRVRGNYGPADMVKPGLLRQAGIFLYDPKLPVKYAQSAKSGQLEYRLSGEFRAANFTGGVFDMKAGPLLYQPVRLCIKRLAGRVWMTGAGEDGKKWECNQGVGYRLQVAKKVKVGVFAEATASGVFKAEFDQFKLTRLNK